MSGRASNPASHRSRRLTAAIGCVTASLANAQVPSGRLVGQIINPRLGPVGRIQLTLQVTGYAMPGRTLTAPDGTFQFILPAAAFGRAGKLTSNARMIGGTSVQVNRLLVIPPASRGVANLGQIPEQSPTVLSQEQLSRLSRPPASAIGVYTQPQTTPRIPDAAIGYRSRPSPGGGIDLEHCGADCRARYFELEDRRERRDNAILADRMKQMAPNDPSNVYSGAAIDRWVDSQFVLDGGRSFREAQALAQRDLARSARQDAIRGHASWRGACTPTPNGGCVSSDSRYVYYTGEFLVSPRQMLPFGRYQLDKRTGVWFVNSGGRLITLQDHALGMGIVENLMKTQMNQYLLNMQLINEQQMLNW